MYFRTIVILILLMRFCLLFINKNQMVEEFKDVHQFEGHIVCDENSKSELCIPFEINSTK